MTIVDSLKNQGTTIKNRLKQNLFITNPKLRKYALLELFAIALVVILNFLQALTLKIVCALTIVYMQLFLILQAPKVIF
jgi:hypothetical protein